MPAVATQSPAEATVSLQKAVLDKIIANTSGTITQSFANVIAGVMPSAAAFRSAYSSEQQRLTDAQNAYQGAQDDQETASDAKVSLVWLHTSGYLDKLLSALQANMDKAAKESAEAAQTAQQQAANAGTTLSQHAVAQAASVPTSQVQAATPQDVTDDADDSDTDTSSLPSTTKQNAQKSLMAGVAAGLAGQVLMMGVQTVIQDALTSMLGMGENAAINAMQSSMMLTISQNPDLVNGWVWQCDFDDSCISCIMMDGSIHDNSETLDSHKNCGCLPVPFSGQVPDLPTGQDWFEQQSDAIQREILGPAKYEAWQSGDAELMDFVTSQGGYIHEASLKSLGLDFRDYLQQLPTKSELERYR